MASLKGADSEHIMQTEAFVCMLLNVPVCWREKLDWLKIRKNHKLLDESPRG